MPFVCFSGGIEGIVIRGEWNEISAKRTDQLYIAYKKNTYALWMQSCCFFMCESMWLWQDGRGEKVLQLSKHIFQSSVILNPPHSWCLFIETNLLLNVNQTTDSILHGVIHCFSLHSINIKNTPKNSDILAQLLLLLLQCTP